MYDRINDLQSDLDLIKKLNVEYADQVKAKVEVIEERNSVIKQLEAKNEKRKHEITELKENANKLRDQIESMKNEYDQ